MEDIDILKELMGGMYIQLLRIYDILALIAKYTPDMDSKIDELIKLHESGKVLAPDPALILDESDESE